MDVHMVVANDSKLLLNFHDYAHFEHNTDSIIKKIIQFGLNM